jgi:hypothetical protein
MNYEQDIMIDPDALDVEWGNQASLMMKYARFLANTRMVLDKAKEALDIVKAELDKDIRSNPDRYGLEKITDKVVENTIPLSQEYKAASERLINAKYEADIAYGAVKSIDARKDALENLVRLHGMQYFAGPSVPRDLSFEMQKHEKQKASNRQIGEAMTEGRKRSRS